MSRSIDLLSALSRAYNLTETRGVDDPSVREALLEARDAAAGGESVAVEVSTEGLAVLGRDDVVPGALAFDLAALGVSRMTVPADVGPAQMERFLGALRDAVDGGGILLTLDPTPDAGASRSVVSLYDQARASAERTLPDEARDDAGHDSGEERDRDVMDLVVSLASEEESTGDRAAEGALEAAPIDEAEGPDATPGEPAEAEVEAEEEEVDRVAERIEELLGAYRDASGPDEAAAEEAIRDEADGLRAEGSLDALSRLVEALIAGAEEGEVPAEAVEIAREYVGHGVMARIAMHLGVARGEEEREQLTAVARRLGKPLASAIADALTDAPDRSARRAYMEAMEAMGEEALEIAESMAGDPRWFISRNGVALLGELGGPDSIQHLTTPLAHSDARLRKETVVTLAKLGGDDAGNLCVGMLGDPDPDVRGSAAMAVGVLKVTKAQRQLLDLLEREENPDVQVNILKALGQLGDPGSVPAIEKRAVGGLFSRSPTDVRIAAYRALSNIGTPHARELLEQATDDKDLEVRTVARSLVDRREKSDALADAEPDTEGDPGGGVEPEARAGLE